MCMNNQWLSVVPCSLLSEPSMIEIFFFPLLKGSSYLQAYKFFSPGTGD